MLSAVCSSRLPILFSLILGLSLLARPTLAYNNGVGRLPPLGWNTWCTEGQCGHDYCDAKEVMEMADVMVDSGMADLGWKYVNLDDCWADYRDEDGTLVADPDRFPGGLVPVIDYIHSKGLLFGLYTDAGLYTCSSGGRDHKIPGSYGHYDQDAQTFAEWGVDYVKMDWCNTAINGTQLQPEVQYSEFSQSLNSTGRSIFFETCEWGTDNPWQWMRAYANSWRATQDHHDDWDSTKAVIEQVQEIQSWGGIYGHNYMDFIMTGGQGCEDNQPLSHCPGMTDTEYITEFTMWVMAGSPLIVATDLRNMTDIMKTVLFNTEMIAVHQDELARPGGIMSDSGCSTAGACQTWGRQLTDGQYFVVLYNSADKTHDITLYFELFGKGWVNALVQVSLRDLWQHADLGLYQMEYVAQDVPAHGVVALLMTMEPITSTDSSNRKAPALEL